LEQVTHLFAEQNLHDVPLALREMSSNERVAAMQDLHGALDKVEETPELISSKLSELDAYLHTIEHGKREAVDEAIPRDADYVRNLRLAFLRAENFDAKKAALRMTAHFTARLSLFETPEVLARDIRLSDFTDERDIFAIKKGIQLLPHPDRVERPVVFMTPVGIGEEPFYLPSIVSTSCRMIFVFF
jgi:hypothetical protein